jgi:predicted oxidoreductase (fatty acid repression mutant protein)
MSTNSTNNREKIMCNDIDKRLWDYYLESLEEDEVVSTEVENSEIDDNDFFIDNGQFDKLDDI